MTQFHIHIFHNPQSEIHNPQSAIKIIRNPQSEIRNPMKPYLLAETTWKTISSYKPELVILPWGATEAHNFHLPFGTDNIETERIVDEAAAMATDKGAKVIVLPLIPFGVNTGQKDIRLDINLNPGTQLAIIKDIVEVLNYQKIFKLLIVNGHGGNDFKQIIRELGGLYPEMFICTCNWFQSVDNSDFFEKSGGHADEMETSLMQFLAPELVLPLSEAGSGHGKKFRVKALNEKWAWAERKWSSVTADTGIGDPSLANPGKGEKYFKAVVSKLGSLITELAMADKDNMYE
jgi:creatinine amidohydrolase